MPRPVQPEDRSEWLRVRAALWPDDHESEVDRYYAGVYPDMMVLVVDGADGRLQAFAEWGLRPWAEGCSTSPVGYLEGIWVDGASRRQRVATALVDAGLAWCRGRGCTEVGSDCLLDNEVSRLFHLSLGFTEVERVISFRMDVPGAG